MRFASHAIRATSSRFLAAAIISAAFLVLSPAAWAASVTAHFSAVQIQVTSCACYGVAVDSSGNVYIADTNNGKVWKETLSGGAYTQSLVAGSFSKPYGVAVDLSGNVYVADTDNNRIVKETLSSGSYTSSGVISGLPTGPYNVAVDANGNVYVAGGNSAGANAPYVYKLTPSGSGYTKTVISGASSGIETPREVAVDSSGNVFVTDPAGNSVYKFTLSGSSYVQGTVATGLNNPTGVAVDANGKVYISNANANQIVVETPSGSAYTPSVFATGPLQLPYELAVDTNGSLYIANPQMGNILREDPAGNFGSVNVGEDSQPLDVIFAFDSAGSINAPAVVTQGAPNLDFGDTGNGTCTTNGTTHSYQAGDVCLVNTDFYPQYPGPRYGAVVLKDSTGAPIATAYIYGIGIAPQVAFIPLGTNTLSYAFPEVNSIALDGNGNVYMADWETLAVYEMPPGCTSTACAKSLGGGFVGPEAIAVDGRGNVYVADTNMYVSAIDEIPVGCASSACVTALGPPIYSWGVAVDGSGNVYASSVGNGSVYEIPVGCTSSRYSNNLCTVKTLAGGFTFNGPAGLAVDGGGNVYVAEFSGDRVKEIPAGCASSACVITLSSGTGSPTKLAVDASGSVYVVGAWDTVWVIPADCATSPTCGFSLPYSGMYNRGVALDNSGNVYLVPKFREIYRASPPSLTFPYIGTATVQNIGNAALTFPLPSTGNNPSVSTSFLWDNSSTCEQTDPSSPEAFSLAAGATCTIAVDFEPGGSTTGSVVLTDNALNAAAPDYATQTISLIGTPTTPAALTSPVSNSVLDGPSETFHWTAATGGASGYILRLGTTQGGNDLYDSGVIASTSVTVSSLPLNGETIYARLITVYGDGGQPYSDYTFTAATPAAISSPAPTTVLAGPKVTFTWSAAPWATAYTLWIGTSPGAHDLYASMWASTTTVTRANLPLNGETIYVRMTTIYGDHKPYSQVYTDYVYTAATRAALTSPAPNSVLPGPTVTFNWSAATGGASSYILRLGTTQGSNNLYGSGQITATTVTRTKLPTNGETIYARLLTIYPSGAQVYNDYTFTAAP